MKVRKTGKRSRGSKLDLERKALQFAHKEEECHLRAQQLTSQAEQEMDKILQDVLDGSPKSVRSLSEKTENQSESVFQTA